MKRAARYAAIALFCLTSSLPALASKNQVIPFILNDDGHLVFEILLNGRTSNEAVIDTGATYPIIDHRAAHTAGIGVPQTAEQVSISGLGGTGDFPIVTIPSLSIGAMQFHDIAAAYNAQTELPGALNVLPALFLPHRVLDFDFRDRKLRAYNRRPARLVSSSASQLEIETVNRLPFVEVSLNGVKGRALIDTGANISYLNGEYAEQALRRKSSLRYVELAGSTGPIQAIPVLSTRAFAIGKFRIGQLSLPVADPEFLKKNGLENEPIMVLGLDILSAFRVQIDRGSGQLTLIRTLTGVHVKPL